MKPKRTVWLDSLRRALDTPASEAEITAALTLAVASGTSRQLLYDSLLGLLEERRAEMREMPEQAEALVEDILDRIWGHCPKHRLLFPHLPVLPS